MSREPLAAASWRGVIPSHLAGFLFFKHRQPYKLDQDPSPKNSLMLCNYFVHSLGVTQSAKYTFMQNTHSGEWSHMTAKFFLNWRLETYMVLKKNNPKNGISPLSTYMPQNIQMSRPEHKATLAWVFSINILHISVCPSQAARWRGVSPNWSAGLLFSSAVSWPTMKRQTGKCPL